MIVESTIKNRMFFPGKSNFAKTYPAIEQKIIFSKTTGNDTITLLRKNLKKGIASNNLIKLSSRHAAGNKVGGQIYVSGSDLNAVNTTQTNGKSVVKTNKTEYCRDCHNCPDSKEPNTFI